VFYPAKVRVKSWERNKTSVAAQGVIGLTFGSFHLLTPFIYQRGVGFLRDFDRVSLTRLTSISGEVFLLKLVF
jgi:hypothetical protein